MTEPNSSDPSDIRPISIVEEMRTSYLDYAMSVIVSRALPDVRDGLKPVHRRILFSCHENSYDHTKPYRKSARIVGDVIGKYHPHGDSAIYEALVRMAQDFSMRVPLIDGQGNFGSMDGDPAAAMRYTEARLAKVSQFLLSDLEKNTVDYQANYDGQEREPTVLPARFPNLLVNGAGGIAVGMATNIPPHNLGEVIAACRAYMDNPEITPEELMEIVPGPDFPTGGIVMGRGGILSAYRTGRGSVLMRSRTHIETWGRDREAIIITEIPYQVNKSTLVERIAEAVKDKRIEGISEIRDESNREGVRVVIELKRDANAEVVTNQIFRYTPAQTSFAINTLALNNGRPQQLGLKDIISAFIQFREEVITRRTKFELKKARDRAHILLGLVIAVTNLDEVVRIIRASASPAEAREALLARAWTVGEIMPYLELIEAVNPQTYGTTYHLTEEQVKAILELRLHRLTALGRDEIGDELKQLATKIEEFLHILRDRNRLYEVMREELDVISTEFATPRKTEILEGSIDDIDDEDLIKREDMVVTVTMSGYIKRVPLSTYRAQRRGGKGRSAMSTKDEDVLTQVFVASTHTPVLFFSTKGLVYRLKVWKLPEGTPQARGKALVNILPLSDGETISTILPLPEDENEWANLNVMFATAKGSVRRNSMDAFTNIPSNGKFAIRFEDDAQDDRLIGVALCNEDDDVLLATRGGKSIRFPVDAVRVFQSRTSTGVRGMTLADGDEVISLTILNGGRDATAEEREQYLRAAPWKAEPGEATLSPERMQELAAREQFILTVTCNGYGKRTSSYEYRTMGRGNQGVTAIEMSERNGPVVASFPVDPDDQVLLVTDQAQMIRIGIADVRIAGRATQGVTLFRVSNGEHVVSVAKIRDVAGDEGDNGDGEADAEQLTDGSSEASAEA
ncbi:MAG TPA: DNA gyrase subunit A [Pedomonas sp.]|uniref:DNA gyrase subunit A n=1 Tax=Pedomonas sp. TaxID=2976421 RepID=UPI002F3E7016